MVRGLVQRQQNNDIHAIAALFNDDNGEVAFSSESKSQGVTFDVTLSESVNKIELQVTFMTAALSSNQL